MQKLAVTGSGDRRSAGARGRLQRAASWIDAGASPHSPLVGSMSPIAPPGDGLDMGMHQDGPNGPKAEKQMKGSSRRRPWERFAHASMMDSVDWLSVLSFSWMDPLFFIGEQI